MLGTLCTLIAALTCKIFLHLSFLYGLTQTPAVHTVSTGQEVVLNFGINRFLCSPQFILRFYHSHSSPTFWNRILLRQIQLVSLIKHRLQFIIKRSEAGDSAVYYCNTWDNSAKEGVSTVIHTVTKTSSLTLTAF
uniref:Immunoglobulin subtype domain-containing protein n=1 Tax=Seriola dumerili TaxID=41447 RepID=A0A3B4UI56_SERDU